MTGLPGRAGENGKDGQKGPKGDRVRLWSLLLLQNSTKNLLYHELYIFIYKIR